jgi:hypothetical protein
VNVSLLLVLMALGASAASAIMTWSLLRRERERAAARVAALGADIDPHPDERLGLDTVTPGTMFGGPDTPARTSGRIRLAVVAAMAVVAVVALAAQYASARHGTPAVNTPATSSPLELMSMRHVRDAGTFTINGLLRNPRRSEPISGLTAVVFAFDSKGTFLTSARAPIDFTTLQPGDESPFAVTLQAPGEIARYRVTFRTEAGVLRHVDRRNTDVSLAVNRE